MDKEGLIRNIHKLIKTSLAEDIRSGDITSEACIPDDAKLYGTLVMKQWGKLAGLDFLSTIFQMVDPRIEVDLRVNEGAVGNAGTVIGTVSGPARGIISAECVALNIVQHASGIATITHMYKEKLSSYGCSCDILNTRKTLPGLRALEKYAVCVGGGKNHRDGLDDRFVIKSNHLLFISPKTKTPIKKAVIKAKAYRPNVKIEIEVENLSMLKEAMSTNPDIIMLKHMNTYEISKAVAIIRNVSKEVYIEACGNEIVLETIYAYAQTGIDGISVTMLTHSIQDLDISLRF